MLDALSSFMDRRATMGDLRKGFVFFMVEERKEIKKLVAMSKARKLQMQDQDLKDTSYTPKEWWTDDVEIYRPVTEWTLQRNEWLDLGQDATQIPPYTPKKINLDQPKTMRNHENSEETDEEFSWFALEEHTDSTYFNFVNKNR